MLTSKTISGWWMRIASNLAQLIYGVCVVSPYLIVNAVTFGFINLRGLIVWKKDVK